MKGKLNKGELRIINLLFCVLLLIWSSRVAMVFYVETDGESSGKDDPSQVRLQKVTSNMVDTLKSSDGQGHQNSKYDDINQGQADAMSSEE